jgi:hypothetical protein
MILLCVVRILSEMAALSPGLRWVEDPEVAEGECLPRGWSSGVPRPLPLASASRRHLPPEVFNLWEPANILDLAGRPKRNLVPDPEEFMTKQKDRPKNLPDVCYMEMGAKPERDRPSK